MKIIVEASALTLYPLAGPGFSGGTELMVKVLCEGLAAYGHEVHLIAADAETDARWAPNLWVWPTTYSPTRADCLIVVHNMAAAGPDSKYQAPLLVLMSNGLDADLGPDDSWTPYLDAVACFSQCHVDLLTRRHPTIPKGKCHVTGLGVDLRDYARGEKVVGQMLFSNDPLRGLWHALDIHERIVAAMPEASLHVGYDFTRRFEGLKWESSWRGQMMWECRRRMKTLPNVVNLGAMTREETIAEELACHLHAMPSDAPGQGSQIHGLMQLECAAAGVPLVLSNTEAFPEVFGEAALILPLPGTYMAEHERRFDAQDWSDACVEIMRDPVRWQEMSAKSRALAETMTWDAVVTRFDDMLDTLAMDAGLETKAVA